MGAVVTRRRIVCCHTPLVAEDQPRLNWGQVAAAAGAAMSATLLLSTLGVTGTIVGAAIGSVVASVGTHTYSRGIRASQKRAEAITRVGRARDDLDRVAAEPELDHESELEDADLALGRVQAELSERRPLPWKRIILGAVVLFVGVLVGITVFELATGRAVSTFTGGSDPDTQTTIPGVGRRDSDPTPSPSPSPAGEPTESPTGSPSPSPSDSPSDSASPSTGESPTPSQTPAGSPFGSSEPSQ